MSEPLKLIAFDTEDLSIVSAHVQDAVTKLKDIHYNSKEERLVVQLNRFVWEDPATRRWFFKSYQRRLCALHFNRVQSLKTKGLDHNDKDQVLSLLALRFTPSQAEAPLQTKTLSHAPTMKALDGTLELVFASNIIIAAQVECIECQLSDLNASWSTSSKPRHPQSPFFKNQTHGSQSHEQ